MVQKVEKKKMPNGQTVERIKEETEGGILHWKRETENAEDLQWFRDEIRKAYGGRAPKVLDPFAGGGAIPLEAMRLGCEATAIDINPVAWFILKCTLEYPQKLAGQKRPLPDFILRNREFMEEFFKAQGIKGAALRNELEKIGIKSKGKEVQRDMLGDGCCGSRPGLARPGVGAVGAGPRPVAIWPDSTRPMPSSSHSRKRPAA